MPLLTIAQLRSEAEALGLVGSELVAFINKQQDLYRSERAAERDAANAADIAAAAVRDHEYMMASLNAPNRPDASIVDPTLRPQYKDGDDITSY